MKEEVFASLLAENFFFLFTYGEAAPSSALARDGGMAHVNVVWSRRSPCINKRSKAPLSALHEAVAVSSLSSEGIKGDTELCEVVAEPA
ncbi:MAG: hypothetical protein IJ326_03895 [Lachnospiraceae bacterium]|nr:hypothetical protein [Lachnospiraceae bacterium]